MKKNERYAKSPWLNLEFRGDRDVGFVYKITNDVTGMYYIGKKNFIINGRDSGWLYYFGSNDNLKEDIKRYGEENFTREILYFAPSKRKLTYYEFHYAVLNDWLSGNCYNSCMLGKFFKAGLM